MQSVFQDIRYEIRQLAKKPAFTFVAILILALGAGANALLCTVIDSVLLRPLPYPNAARLVTLQTVQPNGSGGSVSLPNFQDWRARSRSFSGMAAYKQSSLSVQLPHGDPVHASVVTATANLFDVLRIRPLLGSAFAASE